MKRTRATFLLLASAALTVVLSVATFSPSLLAGEKKDDKKGKSTPDTTAALATTPAEDALTRLARLIPRNSLKAKTGDVTTDNVFANYSLEQVQLMLVEYDKKLENATIQKQDLTRASLETGDRFLKTFPDSRVIDEIAIRQADLLYEKVTDEYQVARVGYDKELQAYYDLQSKYDSGDTASGLSKPIEPDAPKSNLNQVIALYDLIINNMPESPYVVDALYGKAYIYGERTEEYVYSELTRENYPMLSKENEDSLKLTIRRGKKQESITLLQEITRKYPDSRYTIDSYMLIGEYLFDGRPQPGKTIEAIAYYQKALNLMASSSTQSKYYDQALYKLGWSYYRLGEANPDNYREAIAYFTDLTDDIVKVEELYANKILPDFVRPDLKDEAIEYAASGFLSIQKKIDPTKSGVDRVERYFAAMSPERRYEPVVYEKLGKLYEDLLVDPEMVNEIYGTLLRRFPKYERAPLIAQKIIDQLDKATLTEQGKKNVEAGDRLYEERKRLFYSYGKTSPWFADLQRRIIAQNSGDTLAYADRATLGGALDPTILDKVDSITRIALYKNIEYGSDLAEVLAGYREAPLGTTIEKDPGKANVLYRQVVADADEYVKLFSRYDSSAYEALWNRSVILDQRLNRSEEAVDGYIDLAKNHAYTSHRRDAIFNSYGVMDSVMRSRKQGRFTTYADSPRFSGAEIPLTKEEEKFVEVNEAFIRLYPHDTLSITATNDLASMYISKAMVPKYKEMNARLAEYYPIQETSPGTLFYVLRQAYDTKDFVTAEQMARAIYLGRPNTDPKDSARRAFAYGLLGESIFKRGELYNDRGNFFAAAREYERAARETPRWKDADEVLVRASDNYIKAKKTEDAVRVNNYLIGVAKTPSYRQKGYGGILIAYKDVEAWDSAASAADRISDVYLKDSASYSDDALYGAVGFSSQAKNWKKAIEYSDKYLKRFPASSRADGIAFSKIELNQLNGDSAGVYDAYGEYANKYTDKPLSVLAFYKRGEYQEKRGNPTDARKEYTKATERYASLKAPAQSEAAYYTSESYYKLMTYLVDEYKNARVSMIIKPAAYIPPAKDKVEPKKPVRRTVAKPTRKPKPGETPKPVAAAKPKKAVKPKDKEIDYDNKRKNELKDQITKIQLALYKLGGYRYIGATYSTGEIAEDIAEDYAILPDTLSKARNSAGAGIVGFKLATNIVQANTDANSYYLQAGNSYEFAAKKLNDDKEIILAAPKGQSALDSVANQGLNSRDTLAVAADAAIGKAKARILDMFYRAGEVREKNVYTYLGYKDEVSEGYKAFKIAGTPFKIDIFDIVSLQRAAGIASRLVGPSAEAAIDDYNRVILKAKELGLQGDVINKANDAIVRIAPLAAERTDSVAREMNVYFDGRDRGYREWLKNKTGTKMERAEAAEYGTSGVRFQVMKNAAEANFSLANQVLGEYGAAIQKLRAVDAPASRQNEIAIKVARFIYETGDGNIARGKDLENFSKESKDIGTKDFAKFWYSDAEFNYKDLSRLYKESGERILANALTLINDYDINNEFTNKAINRYIESNPAVGKVLQKGARKEITESTGASGWKVTQAVKPTDEWYTKEFDDKAWGSAVENASSTTLEYAAPDDSGKYVDRKQIAVKPIWNKVKTSELPPPEPPKPRNLVPDSAGRGAVPAPSNNITTPSAVPSQPSTVQPVPGVQPKPLEVTPPTGTTPVSPAPVSPVDSGRSGSVIDPNASGRGSAGADSLGIKAAADSAGKLMTADSAKTGDSTGSGAKKPAKKSTKKKKSASLDTFNGRPDVATVMLFVETHEWAQSKKKRPAKKPAATTEKKDETPAPPPEPPKEDVKNVYFRKEFIVEDGAVEVAQLVIYDDLASATASDGSVMEIYLNNDPVENPIIDSLNTKQKRYDVTPYVTPGRNVLALKVPVDTKSDGLKAALNVTYFGKLTEDQIKQLIKFDKEQRKKSKIKESTN